MAAAFDAISAATVAQTGVASGTNDTATITVGATANYALAKVEGSLQGGNSDASITWPTVTLGGVAMTAVPGSTVHSGGGTSGFITLFELVNPPTGSQTFSLTMNHSGSPSSVGNFLGFVETFTGVDTANPRASVLTDNTTGSSRSLTATLTTGQLITGGGVNGSTLPTISTGTSRGSVSGDTSTASHAGLRVGDNSGVGSTSLTFGLNAADSSALTGAVLNPAPTGGSYLDRSRLEPPGNRGPGSSWARPIGSYAAVATSADISVVGLLAGGAVLYGPSTHDATAVGHLAAGAVPFGASTHDATVAGHLASGAAPYSSSGTLAYIVVGHLAGGAILFGPSTHDTSVAGHLASGSDLHGAITHGATVAGLLASGAVLYSPVGHNATVAGHLAAGAVLYGLLSAGSDISVVGFLTGGAALYGPVGHAATVSGLLVAGADVHGPVSHTAAATGLLAGGSELHAPASHTTSVVGLLASGAVLLGSATHSVTIVGHLVGGSVLYAVLADALVPDLHPLLVIYREPGDLVHLEDAAFIYREAAMPTYQEPDPPIERDTTTTYRERP